MTAPGPSRLKRSQPEKDAEGECAPKKTFLGIIDLCSSGDESGDEGDDEKGHSAEKSVDLTNGDD